MHRHLSTGVPTKWSSCRRPRPPFQGLWVCLAECYDSMLMATQLQPLDRERRWSGLCHAVGCCRADTSLEPPSLTEMSSRWLHKRPTDPRQVMGFSLDVIEMCRVRLTLVDPQIPSITMRRQGELPRLFVVRLRSANVLVSQAHQVRSPPAQGEIRLAAFMAKGRWYTSRQGTSLSVLCWRVM